MGLRFKLGGSGGQPEQNNGNGGSSMRMEGGQSMRMDGGQPGMSYPVQNMPVPPGMYPGAMPHHTPMATPGAVPHSALRSGESSRQVGFMAPPEPMEEYGMGEEEMRRGRSSRTGRFVHRAGGYDDEGEGMVFSRLGKGRKGSLGMGHAEGEDSEELETVLRELKKVKRRLQELEEDLEENSGSNRRRRKKRKPHEEEDGEEDEEDDAVSPARFRALGKGLMGAVNGLPAFLENALSVIDSPPPTWPPYLEKKDFGGIAKMEFGELVKAVEQHKPVTDLKKELTHTAAALLQLCAHAGEEGKA